MGGTQDSYMKQEDAADALVGRTVAQLKMTEVEFDSLPPHFTQQGLDICNQLGWNKILPGFNRFPSTFQRVIPYFFALIVHHHNNGVFQQLYPAEHPFFSSAIFADADVFGKLGALNDQVVIANGYSPASNMRAEGIPSLISVSRKLCEKFESIMETLTNNQADLVKRMELFDKFCDRVLEDLPALVAAKLKEDFSIE